jgi:hypothetical protein
MMFRKWMIGACVAVAAMSISGEAEAQGTNHQGQFIMHGVQVQNYHARPVKVKYVWGANRIEGAVAPKSAGLVCPSFAGDKHASTVSVTAGNLPARKFNISANEVRKLFERSGFTPDEAALVIDVRVNKYGVVELRRFYLRKRMPE